jgi:hypothetical protein
VRLCPDQISSLSHARSIPIPQNRVSRPTIPVTSPFSILYTPRTPILRISCTASKSHYRDSQETAPIMHVVYGRHRHHTPPRGLQIQYPFHSIVVHSLLPYSWNLERPSIPLSGISPVSADLGFPASLSRFCLSSQGHSLFNLPYRHLALVWHHPRISDEFGSASTVHHKMNCKALDITKRWTTNLNKAGF